MVEWAKHQNGLPANPERYIVENLYWNNGRWKNPYKSTGNRVQQPGWCRNAASGDANAGFVWINSRNGWDNVTVCTCIKTPCNSSDNRLENTIKLD